MRPGQACPDQHHRFAGRWSTGSHTRWRSKSRRRESSSLLWRMRSVDLSTGFGAVGMSPPNKRLNPTAASDRDRPRRSSTRRNAPAAGDASCLVYHLFLGTPHCAESCPVDLTEWRPKISPSSLPEPGEAENLRDTRRCDAPAAQFGTAEGPQTRNPSKTADSQPPTNALGRDIDIVVRHPSGRCTEGRIRVMAAARP